ncbi:MAG: alpha-hydroxy acid oxidase [Bryobacteraceae bacterium]
MTRRQAARNFFGFLAGSPLCRAFQEPALLADRLPALEQLVNVMEFENVARRNMTRVAYDFIAGGVEDEWTLRRNREGFQKIMLRPRMLVDVSMMDLSLDLYGSRIEMPILVAPTATHALAHTEGEVATMRGACAVKTIMAVSSNSSITIEKVAAAATGPFWFQLYALPDLDATRERVERAVAAGAKVMLFTVDAVYNSKRERLQRDRLPGGMNPARERIAARRAAPRMPYGLSSGYNVTLAWPFLETLKGWAKIPVLVKGIMTPEDALLAIKHGADGIVVSNHGARYLETAPSTIEVLPEIVDAVDGKFPVLMDGGIRRGIDVLKALAIGAKAVLVGRPPLWGLGAFGSAGVQRVMEMLQSELAQSMGLAGKPNLGMLDRSLLRYDR